MKNKIYIDKESWEALNEWSIYNPGLCIAARSYFEEFEIRDETNNIALYVEWKKDHYKASVKMQGTMFAKIYIRKDETGKNDFGLKYRLTDAVKLNPVGDEVQKMVRSAANLVIMINAFLLYGNLAENRTITAAGRNEGENKIIVFRKYQDKIYAVPVGHHRSPEGVFSVRGHFRRYKDGKVVWIDSYFKGKN